MNLLNLIISLVLLVGQNSFSLQEGDLVFQDSDCGPFCEAIEKVTDGYKGARLSHVGIIVEEKGELFVLEAVSKGVVLTEIDSFMMRAKDRRGDPKVLVGRLKKEYQHLIPAAVSHMKTKIGSKYDDVFDINNDMYYCSELVYEGFKVANDNKDVFMLNPMTFKDPDTKELFPIWEDYFKNLDVKVPESEPGLNPGGISRSSKIEIVYMYGFPKGMVLKGTTHK